MLAAKSRGFVTVFVCHFDTLGQGMSDEGEKGRVLLADYAVRYGVNPRSVKRWRAHGVAIGDLVPLEDAGKMVAWWGRNMKLRCPPGIMAAVRGDELPLDAPPKPERAVVDKDEARKAALFAPVDETELGLEQTIKRLAENEVRLSRVAMDPGQARAWLDTVSRLGAEMGRLRVENEKLGKLIPRDRAETMIHEYHQPVEREVRLLYRVMCEITGMPQTPQAEDLWNKECDRLFARFQGEVFR